MQGGGVCLAKRVFSQGCSPRELHYLPLSLQRRSITSHILVFHLLPVLPEGA